MVALFNYRPDLAQRYAGLAVACYARSQAIASAASRRAMMRADVWGWLGAAALGVAADYAGKAL